VTQLFDDVDRAIKDIAAGRPVLVVDDENRENEGDIIFAASMATPELLAFMMEDSRNIRRATSLVSICKHLERIGDHAVNVAEMVIYMVRGTDVRHPRSRAVES